MQSKQPNLCLYGGTFDPIHLGHTFIAQNAVKVLNLDKVIFLPCHQSPHKQSQSMFSNAQRLELCQLATQNLDWAEVSNFDLSASTPSYSWRTVEHFKKQYPDSKLYWLMGTDQWQAFPSWARADYIASMVEIVVYCRDHPPTEHPGFSCIQIQGYHHPASATQIRKQLVSRQKSPWITPDLSTQIKKYCDSGNSPLD